MAKKTPKVLIVGRPNVGKSTLVNRIIRKKKAITDDQPGVTRDIIEYEAQFNDTPFIVMDSGGVWFSKSNEIAFQPDIEEKVRYAIDHADKVLFIVDYKDGLHPFDKSIAKFIRSAKKKTLILVNKVDSPKHDDALSEFYQLGFGEPLGISAEHNRGVKEALTLLTKEFPTPKTVEEGEIEPSTIPKIAIVGRPNVGKSSLINALMNEDRVIVNAAAGTTRDSNEIPFKYHGNEYRLIDTAGMRKKSKVDESIEFYSTRRAMRSIEESDLVILVLDASDYFRDQEKRIVNMIFEHGKNLIVFVNKWDTTQRTQEFKDLLFATAKHEFKPLAHFPFVFGSAKQKTHLHKLLDLIPEVLENSEHRISTAELNKFVKNTLKLNPPPAKRGQRVKTYYGTQAESSPPAFVFFINNPSKIPESYLRFVERKIREDIFHFKGNIIRLFFKQKNSEK